MKAVILAGGLGTRLSEETTVRPKPMVDIGGRPILWHILKIYSQHGVNDFVICCGYKGYVIKEYFANYSLHMSDVTFDMQANSVHVHQKRAEPWKVTLVDTGDDSMTGGRILRVAEYVKDEPAFCLTYGDGVANVDIGETIRFHQQHGKAVTVTATRPPGRFGALDIKDGRVRSFQEKPKGDGGMINGGFFVLSPRVLGYLADDHTAWEQQPLQRLAAEGEVMAYEHHGFWQPMDTLRDKAHLEELWVSGEGPLEDLAMNGRAQVRPAFWQGKRVLLTGHTGFKGSWLSLWLQSLGVQLRGVALEPPTSPSLFNEAHVDAGMEHRIADIRDSAAVQAQLQDFRPEILIHMAAQSLVRLSYQQPIETYATNVMGTVHVLEAARQAGTVRAIVIITTDKCYENIERAAGYREDEPMGGHDPYSSSKGCAELLSAAWRRSFLRDAGIAMATARAGNVIGGGDWATDRLVPDILRALESDQPVLIRNPDAVRPWQHVLEPLSGYLILAERLFEHGQTYAEGWNFGPSDEDARPVQWLVERLCKAWGSHARWNLQAGAHPHEAGYLTLDTSKARQRLQWAARWNLEAALVHIAKWHRAWRQGHDVRAVCIRQISEYNAMA